MTEITISIRRSIYTFCIDVPLAMLIILYVLISRFDLEANYGEMCQKIAERNEKEKAM